MVKSFLKGFLADIFYLSFNFPHVALNRGFESWRHVSKKTTYSLLCSCGAHFDFGNIFNDKADIGVRAFMQIKAAFGK